MKKVSNISWVWSYEALLLKELYSFFRLFIKQFYSMFQYFLLLFQVLYLLNVILHTQVIAAHTLVQVHLALLALVV